MIIFDLQTIPDKLLTMSDKLVMYRGSNVPKLNSNKYIKQRLLRMYFSSSLNMIRPSSLRLTVPPCLLKSKMIDENLAFIIMGLENVYMSKEIEIISKSPFKPFVKQDTCNTPYLIEINNNHENTLFVPKQNNDDRNTPSDRNVKCMTYDEKSPNECIYPLHSNYNYHKDYPQSCIEAIERLMKLKIELE